MMGIDEAADGWRVGGARAGVLVIADAPRDAMAEAAVGMVSARSLGRVAWREADVRLDRQTAVAVVLAEAIAADDGLLAKVLPRLAELARGGARVIVTLDPAQIDFVAGTMAGPGIDLLCEPSPAERVAALAFASAAAGGGGLHDLGRETEAARLQRLHEEVARIAETLARLTRDEPARDEVPRDRALGEPGMGYRAPPAALPPPDIAPREIREAIRARRLRDQFFGQGLFEDPAWDMLLDLFAAELERAQVSVSSLCIAAAVAPTTALRWIARMTDAGLFERHPDPFDRRRAFMGLSPLASTAMRNYVAAVRRVGATVA